MKLSVFMVMLICSLSCFAESSGINSLAENVVICHQSILRHRLDEKDATTFDIDDSKRQAITQRAMSCKAAMPLLRDDAVALNNIGIAILDGYQRSPESLKVAEVLFARAIAIQPDYQEAISNLAVVYFSQGRRSSAIDLLGKNVARNPNDPISWSLLGSGQHTDGQFEQAIESFRKAVAIDPGFATAWQALAFEYLSSGQSDKAIAAASKAVEIDPNYAGAWIDLKLALEGVGRFADACHAVEKIRELLPSSPQAQLSEDLLVACDTRSR